MTDISVFAPLADEEPKDFSELAESCGRFIDAWLAAGGEPADEPVAGFYSLWSQSLDLGRGCDAREEEDFYAWARPSFIRYREEVRDALQAAPSRT